MKRLKKELKINSLPCATVPYFFAKDIKKVWNEAKKFYAIDMEGSIVLNFSKFYNMGGVVIYIITDSEEVTLEESNIRYKKERFKIANEILRLLI